MNWFAKSIKVLTLIAEKECIIDTSGAVCLLLTFQFIKRIPANSKLFAHTPNIFYEPHSY